MFFTISKVAAGSPGPFERKIPSGFRSFIILYSIVDGTTVIFAFKFEKFLKIFFLTPKSKTTILYLYSLFLS